MEQRSASRGASLFWLVLYLAPWLSQTLNLKTLVHTRAIGLVLAIELEPTDHPLAVEQRTGITWERIREIAELLCSSGSLERTSTGTRE